MNIKNLVAAFFMFASALPALAQPPEAVKVEPPNWWPGHTLNPVRVLIHGKNLEGARVEVAEPMVQVGLTRVNRAGSYLFVDLHIDPHASPGPVPLTIATTQGAVQAPFELLEPLPREGRFQGFDQDDVFYLLMPDRFANGDTSNDNPARSPNLLDRAKSRYYHGGDLQGVIDHLPQLKELGITALWLNPFYDNFNHLNEREVYDQGPITDYHGYGATDFYAVEEHFGTLETLRTLVDEAHKMGIKVVQDQVANHTGPYHEWVKDSPTPTWFNGTEANHVPNNWQIWTLADPHATEELQRPTLAGWFIDILPDLNQDDEEVARYTIQNTLWWIGISGLDGIRQDTLPYVPRKFWRDWTAAIHREYPNVKVVGEMWDGDPALVSFFQGGRARYDGVDSGVEALFDFPLFYAVRKAFTGQGSKLREIPKILAEDRLYPDPFDLLTFVGLHDVSRFMSEPGADFTASRLAHTLILTTRGIPVVYYGDEIGMKGGNDPDNRRDFPGGWPGDPHNKFEPAGRDAEENALHDAIRQMIQLRRELEPLRQGRTVHLMVEEDAYAFARVTRTDSALVVFNAEPQERRLNIDLSGASLADGSILQDRLGKVPQTTVQNGFAEIVLPARSAAVMTRKTF